MTKLDDAFAVEDRYFELQNKIVKSMEAKGFDFFGEIQPVLQGAPLPAGAEDLQGLADEYFSLREARVQDQADLAAEEEAAEAQAQAAYNRILSGEASNQDRILVAYMGWGEIVNPDGEPQTLVLLTTPKIGRNLSH